MVLRDSGLTCPCFRPQGPKLTEAKVDALKVDFFRSFLLLSIKEIYATNFPFRPAGKLVNSRGPRPASAVLAASSPGSTTPRRKLVPRPFPFLLRSRGLSFGGSGLSAGWHRHRRAAGAGAASAAAATGTPSTSPRRAHPSSG